MNNLPRRNTLLKEQTISSKNTEDLNKSKKEAKDKKKEIKENDRTNKVAVDKIIEKTNENSNRMEAQIDKMGTTIAQNIAKEMREANNDNIKQQAQAFGN